MHGLKISSHKSKQSKKKKKKKKKKKHTEAIERVWSHSEQEEEVTKHRAEKKAEHIDRFKLFLQRGINTVHEFSFTRKAVCVVVTARNL